MAWGIGERSLKQSLRGFMERNLCSGPDTAGPSSAVQQPSSHGSGSAPDHRAQAARSSQGLLNGPPRHQKKKNQPQPDTPEEPNPSIIQYKGNLQPASAQATHLVRDNDQR